MIRRKRRTKKSPRAKTPKVAKTAATRRSKKKRIGVFGGTFNPIHYGHLNSMETVLTELKLDEIWVVATAQNPLREKTEGPEPKDRLTMVSLGLLGLNQDGEKYIVRDDEIARGGLSYTVETLSDFRKEDKTAEFYLVIGADHLESFAQWRDYQKILKLAHLVVTTRPGAELPTTKDEAPEWLRQEIKSLRGEKMKMRSGNYLHLVPLKDVNVSATEIRRKARMNENIAHLTPTSVADYIREHKLYRPDRKVADFLEFTKMCAKTLEDKGALQTRAYDVSQLVQPSEYTVVASGTSTRHAKALAEHVMKVAKETYGIFPLGVEGLQEGRWVVLDYGALMVHVFYDFVRNEYRLEDLWAQGTEVR